MRVKYDDSTGNTTSTNLSYSQADNDKIRNYNNFNNEELTDYCQDIIKNQSNDPNTYIENIRQEISKIIGEHNNNYAKALEDKNEFLFRNNEQLQQYCDDLKKTCDKLERESKRWEKEAKQEFDLNYTRTLESNDKLLERNEYLERCCYNLKDACDKLKEESEQWKEEAKKEIERKDDRMKSLERDNGELFKLIENAREAIKQKDNLIESLEKDAKKEIKRKAENEVLKQNYGNLQKVYGNLQKVCDELVEEARNWEENYKKAAQEFEEFEQNVKTKYDNRVANIRQHMSSEQEKNLEQAQNQCNEYVNILYQLQQELCEKGDDLRELEEKNTELRKEASKYQSKLGVATNVRLGDEDSVKFRQDILDLQRTLEDYVTNLKPNMDVDIERIQTLAQRYDCSSGITADKPFAKVLLQRKVLDYILLRGSKHKGVMLELDIESKTKELSSLIEEFSTSRAGTDGIVNLAAIKVRQQVYGILSNRGFADVIDPYGNHSMHDFVTSVSEDLNNMMNRYRKINDANKRKEVESMAPKLIQDICRLFFYRLNIQEPKIQFKFFENNIKIDPATMDGRWDSKEVDQLYVHICYFPSIGFDLESSDRKIYTPAKVFPRYRGGRSF